MSLIQASHVTFAYDGSYDNVFEDLSFQVDTDWKLGFTGRNGRGKTTLLRLLMGQYKYQGEITASVDFTYFPCEPKHPDWLAWEALEEMEALGLDPEAVQISISRTRRAGGKHLLLAQNPVFLITGGRS